METGNLNRYAPLETALKKAGYKVDEIEKQGKRTVIAVSEYEEKNESPVCPIFKALKESDFNG
jgi:hypothetical protein